MDTLLKDLKFGARALAKEPGSAVVSVLILALGIGLSTFMFSLVYGVFFRGLDVPEADRIAVLEGFDTREPEGENSSGISNQEFHDFRDRVRSFQGLAGSWGGTVNLADEAGPPERFQGRFVTANTFDVLRVSPVIGRTFVAGEDRPGLPPTVLLGHHVWRDRFGSDPSVLGRSVRINGGQGVIVGVMPEGFQWPSNTDVWVTMDDDPLASARREGRFYSVTGRLADGVSWEQANIEVARVAAQLEAEHPEVNEGLSARILTVSQSQNDRELTTIFTAMMVAVLCVLLVACANVANLLLARAATRTREAGVRVALGAGRWRVMVPFLAEAALLAAAGAVLGTGLAYWAVHLFDVATATPVTGRPYFMIFRVDVPVLLYVVGITVLTALAAGLVPAFQVSRTDVNRVLKDESRGSSSLSLGRLTRGLVVVEVAFSVALLVGAGLMVKSITNLRSHEMPFESAALISGRVGLFEADYPERADRQAFWAEVERRVRSRPDVAEAAITSSAPGTGSGGTRIRLEGRAYDEPSDRPLSHIETVSPSYFRVLDAPILEGEGFSERHTEDAAQVALVNRSFARRFFPDGALGRRFRTGVADTVPWLTVIGVVPDLQMEGFQPGGSPASIPDGFYLPLMQSDPSFMTIVARAAAGPPATLAEGVRESVRSLDPYLPVYDLKPVDTVIFESSWFYAVFGTVFIAFGAAALFMASVGLYGVLSFSVRRRTAEMGIRMALGAGSKQVVQLIMRQGAIQLGIGLAIGLVMAWGVSRVIGILMFQVDPRDPVVFVGVVGTIVVVGLLASFVPAVRATRVDPVVALRAD